MDSCKSHEDADFLPPKKDAKENEKPLAEDRSVYPGYQSDSDSMSAQSSSEEEYNHEKLDDEVKDLQEMPDLKQVIKGLSGMLEQVSKDIGDKTSAPNATSFNEEMEEGNKNAAFSPINLAEAIIEFDDADYDEKADPDYEPNVGVCDGKSNTNLSNCNENDPGHPTASLSPANLAEAIIQFDDANYDEKTDPDYEPPAVEDCDGESKIDLSNCNASDPDSSNEEGLNSSESSSADSDSCEEADANEGCI